VPPAERAKWLAELAEALNAAHELLYRLPVADAERGLANELYLRIEGARLEVQSLRLSRSLNARQENRPEWIEWGPWLQRDVQPPQSP
jgi:acyl-CoA reductase-like NAD-dependent aldehyde dehydrogenase